MEISLILFKKLLIMFIYMFFGYVFFKSGIITEKRNRYLSNILLYIIFPVVIVNSFAVKKTADNLSAFLSSFFLAIISLLISMFISHIIYERYYYKRYEKKMKVDDIGVAFSSAAFMGIPIVASLFTKNSVFYVSSFAAILTFLQWTYGVRVMSGSGEYIKIKKILTNPVLISMLIGLFLYSFEIEVVSPIRNIFAVISYLNAPIVMIILGVYLAQTDILSMFSDKTVYLSSFLRLILIPLLTMLIINFIPASKDIKMIIMIAASAPVGSNVAIFAKIYGGDYKKAVKIVCMSTLLCIISMPMILGISNVFFK